MDRIEGFHDLMNRARAGDRAAIDELLRLIRPWIEQVARDHAALDSPCGSVSDLAQEAWLRAWQKLDQFKGAADEAQSQAMFRAWLARIVSRLGINTARDAAAQQRKPPGKLLGLDGRCSADESSLAIDPAASAPTPSANARAQEDASLVRQALAGFTDPLEREIIRLRFSDGLSLRQIAQRLDCNHETVRRRYHDLVCRLQKELSGLN
jgi:RNA polymerase sigma factor (sigma-70 family)